MGLAIVTKGAVYSNGDNVLKSFVDKPPARKNLSDRDHLRKVLFMLLLFVVVVVVVVVLLMVVVVKVVVLVLVVVTALAVVLLVLVLLLLLLVFVSVLDTGSGDNEFVHRTICSFLHFHALLRRDTFSLDLL